MLNKEKHIGAIYGALKIVSVYRQKGKTMVVCECIICGCKTQPRQLCAVTSKRVTSCGNAGCRSLGIKIKKYGLRASGKFYINPPEKIEALKEKYKDGIPAGVMQDLFDKKLLQ